MSRWKRTMLRSRWVVVWYLSGDNAVVGRVGGGESSSLSRSVATRWSRILYRSAWSSISEFPCEDGGLPGPEAREYVES